MEAKESSKILWEWKNWTKPKTKGFIKSTTLDEAHMSYIIAQQMELQKNYKAAFLYA